MTDVPSGGWLHIRRQFLRWGEETGLETSEDAGLVTKEGTGLVIIKGEGIVVMCGVGRGVGPIRIGLEGRGDPGEPGTALITELGMQARDWPTANGALKKITNM